MFPALSPAALVVRLAVAAIWAIDLALAACDTRDWWRARHRRRADAAVVADTGQATAEYALVLLGAAVVAVALITWATGSGRVGQLFDAVFDELAGRL